MLQEKENMTQRPLAWVRTSAFITIAAPACFAQPGAVTLIANPTTLTFNMQPGTLPPSQTLMITSSPSQVGITVTASSKGNWLVAAPVGATPAAPNQAVTPATIIVSAGAGGPSSGTDTGLITITGQGATLNVSVFLNVFAAATGPAFVVTGPITSPVSLAANTGVKNVSFNVAAKSATQSSIPGVSFQASSSSGVMSFSSSSDCSQPAPVIVSSTSSNGLFACLDTQKVVVGRYVFVLTVRSPLLKLGGSAGNIPGSATEPMPAASVDCSALKASIVQTVNLAVVVNVTNGSAAAAIGTNPSTLPLDSQNLSGPVTISYQSTSGVSSAAINDITTVPQKPDEGLWITIDTSQCQAASLSFGSSSCDIIIGANPFKLIGAAQGTTYSSVLPISPTIGGGAGVTVNFTYSQPVAAQLFPQFADGDDWQTDFILTNKTAGDACADLVFHFESGTTVPIVGKGFVTSIKDIGINAGQKVEVHTTGLKTNPLVYGWVEIVSSVQLSGQALFRRHPDPATYSEAAVGVTLPTASFSVPYDSTDFVPPGGGSPIHRVTGMAIVNPHSVNSAKIVCTDSVTLNVVFSTTLGSYQHAQTTFPILNGSSGTLNCTSTNTGGAAQPIGAVGLLFLGDSAFSSVAIVPN